MSMDIRALLCAMKDRMIRSDEAPCTQIPSHIGSRSVASGGLFSENFFFDRMNRISI